MTFDQKTLKLEPLQVNFADLLTQYIIATTTLALQNFHRLRNKLSRTAQYVKYDDLSCNVIPHKKLLPHLFPM